MRAVNLRAVATIGAAVVAATLAMGVPTLAAVAPAIPSDFNGDGWADLAVAAQEEDKEAGGVTVLFGSSSGITAEGAQRWSQASPGIKGSPETGRAHDGDGDLFGAALTSADFDADGYADLAVAVPHDRAEGVRWSGAVNVLYGSRRGLTADGNQRWSRANLPGDPSLHAALAAGDLDGDGIGDLAVSGTIAGTPVVIVLFGTADGLSVARTMALDRSAAGPSSAQTAFGSRIAAADLDADGMAELAVSAAQLDCPDACTITAAEVVVVPGSAAGPDPAAAQVLVLGSDGTAMASALTAGDFDGDGWGDLAIGESGRTVLGTPETDPQQGAVLVRYGSVDGLVADREQLWSQASPGVPDDPEAVDLFGHALAAGDLDGDGHDDLAIGIPYETSGDLVTPGAVTVLYGTATGITADRVQFWTQATPGVPGDRRWYDEFGAALAIAQYGKSGGADLAIGAPGSIVQGVWRAGELNVLYGRGTGLSTRGAQLWSQASDGVPGSPEKYDSFGAALTP